jgi:hypothetical protein
MCHLNPVDDTSKERREKSDHLTDRFSWPILPKITVHVYLYMNLKTLKAVKRALNFKSFLQNKLNFESLQLTFG